MVLALYLNRLLCKKRPNQLKWILIIAPRTTFLVVIVAIVSISVTILHEMATRLSAYQKKTPTYLLTIQRTIVDLAMEVWLEPRNSSSVVQANDSAHVSHQSIHGMSLQKYQQQYIYTSILYPLKK